MTRIDRYILVIYLRVLLICFLSLAGLMIIVDIFSHLDEFLDYGKIRGSVLMGLIEYYGPYMLSTFDRLAGILTLMSTMFVIAWLYRTNELTAILAAGISKRRVMRPILLATVAIMVFALINREFIIPRFADSLGKNPQDLKGKKEVQMRPMYDQDQDILIGGRILLVDTMEIVEPVFRLDGPAAAIGSQISAGSAVFLRADENHPNGYLIVNVHSPRDLDTRPSVWVHDKPRVLTSADTPWLGPMQCFVASDIEFDLLEGGNSWKQYASTSTLLERVWSDPRYYGEDVRVAIHARFLRPFVDFSLVLLGIPIVLIRQDRHLFWVAGASLGVIGIFMIVVMASHAIGSSGTLLTPMLAAWIPLLIFLPIGWSKTSIAMQS